MTDSAEAEIFIEFKWKSSDDPFCAVHDVFCSRCNKDVKSFLHETKGGNDTLGQITGYAAAHFSAQFRTHVYSILIVKDTVRILRWDRSGTIVTEAIKYNKSPLLAEFFLHFSKASPQMHGMDQSVSDPSPTEAEAARYALGLDETVPLAKLEIHGADNLPHYFVTSTPRATPYPPPGRATRGFPAYDISRKTTVFVKDSWRVELPDIQLEGLTYRILKNASVRNIPDCLESGDVSTAQYHATKTHDYVEEVWACHSDTHFIPHRHYRLALDVIGDSITNFQSSYQMVSVVRDALIGELTLIQ